MTLTTRHVPTPCPNCTKALDSSTHADQAAPKPGDVSICFYCAAPLVYDEGLVLRCMTDDELAAHMANPDFVRILRSVERHVARSDRR